MALSFPNTYVWLHLSIKSSWLRPRQKCSTAAGLRPFAVDSHSRPCANQVQKYAGEFPGLDGTRFFAASVCAINTNNCGTFVLNFIFLLFGWLLVTLNAVFCFALSIFNVSSLHHSANAYRARDALGTRTFALLFANCYLYRRLLISIHFIFN